MSLDHIWASCPEYNLDPLLDATNARISTLTPGVYVKHTTLDGSLHKWTTLLSLSRLDHALVPAKYHSMLKEALPQCEWAFGSLLWIIWKYRNKEIYGDEDYIFHLASLLDELDGLFNDFHRSF